MCSHENTKLIVHGSMWIEFFDDIGFAQYWICLDCDGILWCEPQFSKSRAYASATEFKNAVSEWRKKVRMNAVSHLGSGRG